MGNLCAKDFCCMVYKDCNNVRKVSITHQLHGQHGFPFSSLLKS